MSSSAPPATHAPSSTDAGVATAQPSAVAFWDADHGIVGTTIGAPDGTVSGELRVTWDGGRSWSPAMWTQGAIAEATVAGSADAWVTTTCDSEPCEVLLYHTADGGVTWTSSWTDLAWVSFVDAQTGWGIAGDSPMAGGPSTLEHTTDGGRTWLRVPSPCDRSTVGPLRTIAFRSRTDGLAVCALTAGAGGELHAVLATTDGGAHWTTVASTQPRGGTLVGTLPYGGYINGIVAPSARVAWIWGDRMAPLVSNTGGLAWSPLGIGDPDANTVSAVWPVDGKQGFALLWDANAQQTLLEATSDGGRRWTQRYAWPVVVPPSSAALNPSAPPSEWVDVEVPIYVAFAGQPISMAATSSLTGGPTQLRSGSATVDFGDGTFATRPGSCGARIEFAHRYRAAGDYQPRVVAIRPCKPTVGYGLSEPSQTVHVLRAAPAESAHWPTCHPSSLRIAGFPAGVGLGNVAARITLANEGASSCVLEGYPRIVLLGFGGRPLATHDRPATTGAYLFPAVVPARVGLGHGETASFMLGYTDNPFGAGVNEPYEEACPTTSAVRVVFPGTNSYGWTRLAIAPCGGLLDVSPIVPGAEGLQPG